MLANGGPDRGWRDDLGDAGRPNSAKINAVEWAIDVSLSPACLSGRNQGGHIAPPCRVPVEVAGGAATVGQLLGRDGRTPGP
jgi:hypothetical protein